MKFKVEHRFRGITVADFETLYFDEAFNVAMCQALNLGRTLLSRELVGTHMRRTVRIVPDREIPAPAAKVLGSGKLEYTEHLDYTLGSGHGVWHTVSSIMPEKVDSRGTFAFAQRGDDVVRTVEGEVKVAIFGLGGIVEGFIVADVQKSYERAADFMQKWIDGHRAG